MRRINEAFHRSGLTQAEFAARIGTSRTRLSTYLRGTVMPSAALLIAMESRVDDRMRRAAERDARILEETGDYGDFDGLGATARFGD